MPSSKHNAAKVAQQLGTPKPENETVTSFPISSTTANFSNVWSGPEPDPAEVDQDALESTTALYHDAIRSRAQQHTITIDPALRANDNCSVDIYDLPEGTNLSQVLYSISQHSPVGHIYKCELLEATGCDSSALRVVRIRFKTPDSASILFQIGNQSGSGFYIDGTKVRVRFTRLSTSAYLAEGTRVVVFRGPKDIVDTDNLKRVWGGSFLWDQVEKVVQGPVRVGGVQEVEWCFFEFAWGAQVAKSLFENAYGRREDCLSWYGVDPCA
ncbi:hypothetical protein VP1G_07216 [Cytospora mali]|uniref:Uncharacterized protein n=1 Tax=Cytospora mali TaxID=578113 RepID=A0A194V7N8_CYTMA|nr:hypothetical protein VP1G_07216 [Valsa mali var. pyri (nom. inval.)]